MKQSRLLTLLFLQIFFAMTAIGLFRWIDDRSIASALAGSGFVILGFIAWKYVRRDGLTLKHPLGLVSYLFLFLFAVPMLLVRLIYWGVPFTQLHLMGVPATLYHKGSEIAYLAFVLLTVYFLIISIFKKTKSP